MKQKFVHLLAVICQLLCVQTLVAAPDPTGAYITEWDLSKQDSYNTTIQIFFGNYFTYEYYWENIDNPTQNSGDNIYLSGNTSFLQISNLTANGKYRLYIKGITRIYNQSNSSFQPGLIKVTSWGDISWTDLSYAFYYAKNLTTLPTEAPDLSRVTNMSYMFAYASAFNQNIGNWNTANVSVMSGMFYAASKFNQNIGSWNTENVFNMSGMFYEASEFNQNIGNWNTKNVTNMASMFNNATAFNQNIGNWNTENVTNMASMFTNAIAFNQNISNWNTANVTNMREMFYTSSTFNQNIGNWNTANVTDMSNMFNSASAFNQNIGNWNTSKVSNMSFMFFRATAFNQNIGNWNTDNVTIMAYMFYGASAFNQPIGNWNTANVINMAYMFYGASAFNQPISNWSTANVINMAYMFYGASAFNQNIGNWKLNNGVNMGYMLSSSGMDCGSYSATLNGWNTNNPALAGRNLGNVSPLIYNSTAQAARAALVERGWTISGDTYNANCVGALPVHFGDISATISNGQLTVNWRTLSETENSHFDIEATTDGTGFTTIGCVQSLAKDGNASTPLVYTFSKDITATSGIIAASLALISLGCFAGRNRKKALLMITVVVLLTTLAACSKKATSVDADYSKLFIRVKQVDTDGGFTYSKLVKVVQQ